MPQSNYTNELNQKLQKWAQKLLDLGKINPLINFKDRKSSTVEFLSPRYDEIFSMLNTKGTLEVFEPKPDYRELDPTHNEAEAEDEKILSRSDYFKLYSSSLKKYQVLPYSQNKQQLKPIKAISKKANTAIQETGINIAYLAFGFVHWNERGDSQVTFKAPILLLPVSIINESKLSPTYISLIDDDVVVNPSFNYKLSTDFNISLPEFEGDDISSYFDKIENMVMPLGWSIKREVKLGTFSFLKINMYRDLLDNADRIIKNDIVRALMEGDAFGDSLGETGRVKIETPNSYYNVIDADASQIEAIAMAKKGKSFVLQGPPGTGKSQTITNIIAECLMAGRKVLFVSEKLAALEVVYDKLKKVGLDDFCLQLHSYKANKKDVIAELERTLKLEKKEISTTAERELIILERTREKLDTYAYELHKKRDVISMSLFELFEAYSVYRKIPDYDFLISDIKKKNKDFLTDAVDKIHEYVELSQTIGINYRNNAWYGYVGLDTSYAESVKLKECFVSISNCIESMQAIARRIKSICNLSCDSIIKLVDGDGILKLLQVLGSTDFILPSLLNVRKMESLLKTVKEMKSLSSAILTDKKTLDDSFDKDIYKLDGSLIHEKLTRFYSSAFKRLFDKDYKALHNEIRLSKKDGKKIKYNTLCSFAKQLADYQERVKRYSELEVGVQSELSLIYNKYTTDWDYIIAQVNGVLSCPNIDILCNALSKVPDNEFITMRLEMIEICDEIKELYKQYSTVMEYVSSAFDHNVFDLIKENFECVQGKLTACLDNLDKRNSWIAFAKLIETLNRKGILSFVDFCVVKNIQPEDYEVVYQKTFYKQWIDEIISSSATLSEFTRAGQDNAVYTFTQKDKLQFEINKAKIVTNLSARRPDLNFVAGGSAISILLREAQKKRRQKPIRVLMSEIGELAQVLKPCFLMSPLSVSTFLDNDKITFDTIIFDEASQIFPQDAIGAIYRGKQLIVVGDSKQMPPSNFFNAMTASEDYDDDEEEDITDFESVLDICSATLPQLRLKWHYRSRFEELISFSNKNFYEGDLISFPSAQVKCQGVGVDYYYVNGIFDRKTKTNRAEAERVVDLIYEHAKTHSNRSLGVIAFSVAQQDLIETCLAKRREGDPSQESFFNSHPEEPLFIKNLETVQGDERDTIIFSMAYARDSQGRFMANFGPINRIGGERRLNVAVTRAKYNIQFVTSMHAYDIDLKGSQSEGARLLREYVDFAEHGLTALNKDLNVNAFNQFDSDFELDVYDFLVSHGYSIDTQVGCSKFRIDLALKRPNTSDYILAIECDGATYHSSATARDRDRLRQQILENMGWKFYRIWSIDWFKNNSVEKQRLLDYVKKVVAERESGIAATRPITNEGEQKNTFVKEKTAVKLRFPYYTEKDVYETYRKTGNSFERMVVEILRDEAPLSEEWFLKRVAFLFEREKVTSVVQGEFNYRMRGCERWGIVRRNDFLYLSGEKCGMLRVPSPHSTPREIKYISLEELANGLYEILKHNIKVEKDGLFKELVSELGFNRLGDAATNRLNNALHLLKDKIIIEGTIISIKER